jgi:hypothetical protein
MNFLIERERRLSRSKALEVMRKMVLPFVASLQRRWCCPRLTGHPARWLEPE